MVTNSIEKRDPFRWVMLFFVCMFFYIILGFTNQSFNILLATITEDMGWTATQRTAIASAMSSGMIWFVFVAGILMDKFSIKKVYGSAILIGGILVLLRGQAQGFIFFFILMFGFGAASAFWMPASVKIISLWFGRDELAIANGFLTAASPMGQFTANVLAVKIMYAIGGWQTMYLVIGIAVVVLVVAFFVFSKDRGSMDAALTSSVINKDDVGLLKNVKGILKVPEVWLYIVANTFFLGTIYAGGAYGQFILQTAPNWQLDKAISGRIPAANNLFSMFAYILVPIFIAKVLGKQHYRKVAVISGIAAPLAFYWGYSSFDFTTVMVASAIAGIFFGGSVPANKVLLLSLPEVSGIRAGTALGVYTTVERIGITVMITTIGGLVTANPAAMGTVFARFWLLMLVAPVLIVIAGIITNKKKKARASEELKENA
jgi:MFS family permease